ncbi:hypothetical protein IAE24_30005, partial [Delftia sp. S65]|nr:hypothetical protein [Delftia sp. S65]
MAPWIVRLTEADVTDACVTAELLIEPTLYEELPRLSTFTLPNEPTL